MEICDKKNMRKLQANFLKNQKMKMKLLSNEALVIEF